MSEAIKDGIAVRNSKLLMDILKEIRLFREQMITLNAGGEGSSRSPGRPIAGDAPSSDEIPTLYPKLLEVLEAARLWRKEVQVDIAKNGERFPQAATVRRARDRLYAAIDTALEDE